MVSTPSTLDPKGVQRIAALDGLRALAVCSVLWGHLPHLEGVFAATDAWIRRYAFDGAFGVDIFFVLSSFLITSILLQSRGESRWETIVAFYRNRSLRILPIYLLALGITALIMPSSILLWCLAYYQNIAFEFDPSPHPLRHTWTLAIEEQFYLLWPFFVLWCPRAMAARICIIALPIIFLLFYTTKEILNSAMGIAVIPNRMLPIVMLPLVGGAILAYHRTHLLSLPRPGRLLIPILLLSFLLYDGILWASLSLGWHLPFITPLILKILRTLTSVILILTILVSVERGGRLATWLSWRPLVYLGTISYGLYLYHFPLYYFGREVNVGSRAIWILTALAATVVAAIASYHVLERPLLSFKRPRNPALGNHSSTS